MECERKNNHRKDETVSGKKLQCAGEVEEFEGFLGPEDVDVDFRRNPERIKRRKRAQDFRDFQLG